MLAQRRCLLSSRYKYNVMWHAIQCCIKDIFKNMLVCIKEMSCSWNVIVSLPNFNFFTAYTREAINSKLSAMARSHRVYAHGYSTFYHNAMQISCLQLTAVIFT